MSDRLLDPIPEEYFKSCEASYGEKKQIDITIEELAELSKACNKLIQTICKMSRKGDEIVYSISMNPMDTAMFDNLIEECGDVMIMVNQLVYTKKIAKFVNRQMKYKIDRL